MNNCKKKSGYTFIELMIALSILTLILPVIFGVLFVVGRQQAKVLVLQEVKRSGDYALNAIQTLTRQYGRSLHSAFPPTSANQVCVEADSSYDGDIYIKDQSGNTMRFFEDEEKIASESAKSPTGGSDETLYLTSDKVAISSLLIGCERFTSFDPPILSISFTASQKNDAAPQEESAQLNYQTKIKLRNE